MSTPRPSAIPLESPSPARSRSLRSILWFGVALCLLLGIGSFAVVIHRVLSLTDDRAEARDRYYGAIENHDRQMIAILERDPEAEVRAKIARDSALSPTDLDALVGPLARIDRAVAAWELAPGPETLAAVRTNHDQVGQALRGRARATFEHYQRSVAITVGAGVVLIALGSIFAVAMVSWILRRTARPLEHLSRLASSNASFPAPEGIAGVREVDTLAWALHELDLAVRDREERLAEAHQEAVELSRFGEHVQQVVDESELHDALAGRLLAVSDAHAAVVLVRSGSQGRLAIARATAEGGDRIRLPILDEPMKCRAVRTLKPVMCDGGSATACKCELVPEAGSSLCEPMLAAGELVGVVTLQADWRGHFTDRMQKRVHASLGFGATALASLRLLAATRERALRDPLTGAYNRAFLTEYLNKQLAAASRRGVGVGVLAVDLDHFKRLNDTHGHAAGDRALIATVDAIQREVRSADAVVRHGGEELIVVLADSDLKGATEVAERIRRAIEEIAIETDQGSVPVRASLGVAAFPEHGHDQATLLAAADRALYQAKDLGRNRVIAADRRDSAAFGAQN